jgi:hypothetical protein
MGKIIGRTRRRTSTKGRKYEVSRWGNGRSQYWIIKSSVRKQYPERGIVILQNYCIVQVPKYILSQDTILFLFDLDDEN